jgi:3-oxoadipate enol-lactonase
LPEAGAIDLHYEVRGPDDGPPLLLICGIPAVVSDWAALAEPLSERRRTIAYDNRGSGDSEVTPAPYSMRQLAGDGLALMDRLGIERADVCGFSLGGMIAQELALSAPERVGHLILGCTHAGIAHAAAPPPESTAAFQLQTDDWAERMRALAPFAFAPGVDPEFLERFIQKKSADVQDPEGYRGQIAAVLGHDTRDRLGRITAPTLVVTGDSDQVIPAASSRPVADGIPGARLHVIEGAGHLFFLEAPDETLALFEGFLSS